MSIIRTDPARCQDCYLCVRSCPVKAIRVKGAQAQVVEERCIGCGACVRVCPQGAKSVRCDVPLVQEALAAGQRVVASVAPSAPAFFSFTDFEQVKQALHGLGLADAGEATLGGVMVAAEVGRLLDGWNGPRPLLSSACPAVVMLIERYYPDLLPHLAPLASPMLAHARWLKQTWGEEAFVVCIAPGAACKMEASSPAAAGAIDAALTFAEVAEWLDREGIQMPAADPPRTPAHTPDAARLLPLEGGLLRNAGLDTDRLNRTIITISGSRACRQLLEDLCSGGLEVDLVEMLLCPGGCASGAIQQPAGSPFLARQRIMDYARQAQPLAMPPRAEWPDLRRSFANRQVPTPAVSEEQIQQVLRQMDKHTPEDELNCGACGYATCRDKAIATLQGMAETTMCMPYMKRQAESIAKMTLDLTPNLVVGVDGDLRVVSMSPSAARAFGCDLEGIRHRPLSDILSPIDDFVRVREANKPVTKSKVWYRPDLVVEQTVVPAVGDKMMIAIMRDITAEEKQKEELGRLTQETIARSQEVIDRQMRVAHEIASLLGETTAESKIQLGRLIKLVKGLEG